MARILLEIGLRVAVQVFTADLNTAESDSNRFVPLPAISLQPVGHLLRTRCPRHHAVRHHLGRHGLGRQPAISAIRREETTEQSRHAAKKNTRCPRACVRRGAQACACASRCTAEGGAGRRQPLHCAQPPFIKVARTHLEATTSHVSDSTAPAAGMGPANTRTRAKKRVASQPPSARVGPYSTSIAYTHVQYTTRIPKEQYEAREQRGVVTSEASVHHFSLLPLAAAWVLPAPSARNQSAFTLTVREYHLQSAMALPFGSAESAGCAGWRDLWRPLRHAHYPPPSSAM